MGKTCCVPKCRSGYRNVDMTGISMHSFKKHWKGKIPREGNWKVTKAYISGQVMSLPHAWTQTVDE